jgi:hypothetical protein
MHASFEGVADGPVIALARLILIRAKLSLPCTTRTQAIAVIRGIKPAPSRRKPLNMKPCDPTVASLCRKCGKPILFGQACRTFDFTSESDEHITCPREFDKLYGQALEQINW